MFINSTLVVQVGSFCIAYGMLRILLFKPTVKIILEQEIQRHEVDERIVTTTQAIHQLTTTYQEQNEHDQQMLKTHCPVLQETEPRGAEIRDFQIPIPPAESELSALQNNLANTIVRKVTNVS